MEVAKDCKGLFFYGPQDTIIPGEKKDPGGLSEPNIIDYPDPFAEISDQN